MQKRLTPGLPTTCVFFVFGMLLSDAYQLNRGAVTRATRHSFIALETWASIFALFHLSHDKA